MRIKFFSDRLAAPAAALCAAAMMLSLGACGETAASDDAGDKSSDNTTSQIAGVVAKGDPGSKPQISLNSTPMTVKDGAYAILQEGDGDVIEDDDRVCVQAIYVNVKDGSELASTWEDGVPDCSLSLADGNLVESYRDVIVGQKVNATIAWGINDENSSGTSYLSVLTFVSKSKDYTRATGEKVKDIPSDLPKVTLDKDGKPSIDMNGYKGSDKLVVQPLIQGDGATVAEDGTVKAHYTGWLLDGTQFDSSWDRGEASEFALDQVIKGWTQGLAGQKVGSQVLLVIPPDLGYGSTSTGSIPADSTLVFVVDILATY
ncbi:FKBP-type peptidyl-prolyl cis-trans isomerase [Bifidobacterium samirii]|uniref:Peptidyl-prolyl cis-trans isomerase n=1 Tax=Bifidobacterium samirii TaxID=2306974 RepID=A0A430FR16_9BIFI|nr:FKBP-type peptidyl-prolyl cis-trans isomerase [Bifidobacterium samirii]RSX55279.1 peptidyl-prolyl cis-trans isomerase [Bifidobacterium samirii]